MRRVLRLLIFLNLVSLAFSQPPWSTSGPFVASPIQYFFHPTNPSIVFMYGFKETFSEGGLFRSVNRGLTWSRLKFPEANPYGISLVIAPKGSNRIVATGNYSIYESNNAGSTWKRLSDGYFQSLAFDPNRPNILYGSIGKILRKSQDGGRTWSIFHVFPKNGDSFIRVDPSNGQHIFVPLADEVFHTIDGGNSWIRTAQRFGAIADLVFNPANPQQIYLLSIAGFFQSMNAGISWTLQCDCLPSDRGMISISSHDPSTIFVAASGRLFRSHDEGKTWQSLELPIKRQNYIGGVGVSPHVPGMVFSGAYNFGVFRSLNWGDTWENIIRGSGGDASVVALRFSPGQPQVLFTLADNGLIYKSTDFAKSWSGQLLPFFIKDLRVHPRNPNLIVTIPAVSTDGGMNWSVRDALKRGNFLSLNPADPDVVYFVGPYGADVRKSTDLGKTSVKISKGFQNITALTVNSRTPPQILAGTAFGDLFSSTNDGSTWTKILSNIGTYRTGNEIRTIVIDQTKTGIIYVVNRKSGIYRTTNAGKTWEFLPIPNWYVWDLTPHPKAKGTIFVVAGDFVRSAVFISYDRGDTWKIIPNGTLPNIYATKIRIAPDGSLIYLGTSSGTFRYKLTPSNVPG